VGMKVLDPLRAYVKVADCCYPSFVDALTCIKSLEICVESNFATVTNDSQ
jgi:hypothetical protein